MINFSIHNALIQINVQCTVQHVHVYPFSIINNSIIEVSYIIYTPLQMDPGYIYPVEFRPGGSLLWNMDPSITVGPTLPLRECIIRSNKGKVWFNVSGQCQCKDALACSFVLFCVCGSLRIFAIFSRWPTRVQRMHSYKRINIHT